MATVRQALESVNYTRGVLAGLIADSIQQTEKTADELQAEQMEVGLDAYGKSIGTYSPFTIARKKKQGKEYRFVTGYDTGSMHRSIFLTVDPQKMNLFSRSKTAELFTARYGDGVWGLSPEFMDKYRLVVMPALIEKIKERTGFK